MRRIWVWSFPTRGRRCVPSARWFGSSTPPPPRGRRTSSGSWPGPWPARFCCRWPLCCCLPNCHNPIKQKPNRNTWKHWRRKPNIITHGDATRAPPIQTNPRIPSQLQAEWLPAYFAAIHLALPFLMYLFIFFPHFSLSITIIRISVMITPTRVGMCWVFFYIRNSKEKTMDHISGSDSQAWIPEIGNRKMKPDWNSKHLLALICLAVLLAFLIHHRRFETTTIHTAKETQVKRLQKYQPSELELDKSPRKKQTNTFIYKFQYQLRKQQKRKINTQPGRTSTTNCLNLSFFHLHLLSL